MLQSSTTLISEAILGASIGLVVYLVLSQTVTRILTLGLGLVVVTLYARHTGCENVNCLIESSLAVLNQVLGVVPTHPIFVAAYPTGVYLAKRLFA